MAAHAPPMAAGVCGGVPAIGGLTSAQTSTPASSTMAWPCNGWGSIKINGAPSPNPDGLLGPIGRADAPLRSPACTHPPR